MVLSFQFQPELRILGVEQLGEKCNQVGDFVR